MNASLAAPLLNLKEKSVTILGSTGSIGRNTVDLISAYPDKFKVRALTAYRNVDLLAKQAIDLNAEYAVIADESLYKDLKKALGGTSVRVEAGHQAIVDAAALSVDWLMAAIVGAIGVESTLKAIESGTTVALANKESLVCAGPFMMEAVKKSGSILLPVDSEHNAVFQVFDESQRAQIKRIILTASGGPFLRKTRDRLADITPEQAIKHPTWAMGPKISVDSATMMNKSLEIIEAAYLFDLKSKDIDVLIHPESTVHSMVEYIDGSILAQMGASDMRTPIAHTLAWPERIKTTGNTLDLVSNFRLSFEPIDNQRFSFVPLARSVLETGGAAPTIFNAANEVAVEAFLSKRLKFSEIESVVAEVLEKVKIQKLSDIQDIFHADKTTRSLAEKVVTGLN